MDTTTTTIDFDAAGRCNFCRDFEARLASSALMGDPADRDKQLESTVAHIKSDGKGKPYDCIVGVSGGVDSSWALVQAKRLGLRPLAVHMDNGWNSELAVNNIANLIERLDVDLFTYVIEWKEYRALMQAFFDADVIDVELLYDNAMWGVCFQQAAKYGITYILSGSNHSTEGLVLPADWRWRLKWDATNIRAIARASGAKVRTFPLFSTWDWLWAHYVRRRRWVSFLDYVDYRLDDVISELVRDYGYKPYPYKHYESVFTRFYQGYLLPEKFGVDKRKVHLSALIITGQLTRDNALAQLAQSPYASAKDLSNDRDFFLSKMGWTQETLDEYLSRPRREHDEWPTDRVALALRWLGRVRRRGKARAVTNQ